MLKKILNRLDLDLHGELDPSKILLVGVDVSSRKHDGCLGVGDRVLRRKLTFANSRDGLARLEAAIAKEKRRSGAEIVIVGMEPTGVYWKPLHHHLQGLGHAVVLVHGKAVQNNRKTMADNGSQTDRKDAYCILDLMRQGKCFLPIRRDPEQEAAYRFLQHYEDSKKRCTQISNQLRALLALAFPELNPRLPRLDGPTALTFLERNPTPASIRRLGLKRFLKRYRGSHGRWGREHFEQLYELSKSSLGVEDVGRAMELEIQTLVKELRRAVELQEQWFQHALPLLEERPAYRLLRTIKGIGPKVAVGVLACVGQPENFKHGKQWVKLAGLDLRLRQSGTSVHAMPVISRQGKSVLRTWLYHAAFVAVRYDGPFRDLYERRQRSSPGPGAKTRALMAVADKMARVVFAMLRDECAYDPNRDPQLAAELQRSESTATAES